MQLDVLQECPTSETAITRVLNELPEGLDGTYERVLESLHESRQEQIFRLLSWLSFYQRPLSLAELAEASVIDSTGNLDPEERFGKLNDALNGITTLVTVYSESRLLFSRRSTAKQSSYVRFAHFSVQEYLKSERINTSPARKFSIDDNSANVLIANACLHYHIQASQTTKLDDVQSIIKQRQDFVQFPLWRYVVEHWMTHVEAVPQEIWPTTLRECAKRVLTMGADALLYMVVIHDPSTIHSLMPRELSELVPPLFYVSAAGCPRLLTMLLRDKSIEQTTNEINAVWDHRYATALQAASTLAE